jgi:hypothetical protein
VERTLVRTVRRAQQRYDEAGLVALGRKAGYPKGRHRSRTRDLRVAELKARGDSNREIGRRLGCDEKAVRKRLRRLGWKASKAEQISLPLVSMEAPGADPNMSGSPALPVKISGDKPVPGADPNMSGSPALPVEAAGDKPAPGADPNLSGSTSAPAIFDLPFTMDDDPADRRSQSHVLVDQMSHYFQHTATGRLRASRIVPEPFFVHSELTSLVQIADFVAYIIAWGVRVGTMNRPARSDLTGLAEAVLALRYFKHGDDYPVWGFAIIDDLRPRDEKPR